MKIIVEGAKGVGKTTLTNKLKDALDLEVIHSDAASENDMEYHLRLLLDGKDTILERFHLGEIIYSIIYDRIPKIYLYQMLGLHNITPGVHLVILWNSDIDLLVERLRNRDDGRVVDDQVIIDAVNSNTYFKVIGDILKLEGDSVHLFDTAKLDVETEVFDKVMEIIK